MTMPLPSPYNEMFAVDGTVRPHYAAFADWLRDTPPERIAQNRHAADLLFHRVGITFAVYGEAAGTERLIPFDIVPHIIPRAAPARRGPESLPLRHLPPPGDHPRRAHPRRTGERQRAVPPRDGGRGR